MPTGYSETTGGYREEKEPERFPIHGTEEEVARWISDGGIIDEKLDAGCSVWTPLQYASATGNSVVVGLLLKAGASDSTMYNVDSLSALHIACRYGHEEIVRLLLEANPASQLNTPDNAGFSPLHHAAACGAAGVVQTLLEAGAFPSLVSKMGFTALELAGSLRHAEVQSVLRSWNREQPGPLHVWLESIGLGEYAAGFVASGFHDLDFVRRHGLDEDDMSAIGVTKPGHRKMLRNLYKLPTASSSHA